MAQAKILTLLSCLFLLGASPAHAAPWTVDKAASFIAFEGENSGEKFFGKFGEWDAMIDFDPAKPETSDIKVTIKTASAKTGTMTYDSTLPKREWFDAETYPDAVFESKEVKSLGGDKYEAKGTLTIKTVTKDITLPFTLTKIDETKSEMNATFPLDRLEYEVGKKADPKGEWVSKDIPLSIRVTALQKK